MNELAEAIQWLGSMPEFAAKMGRAGWETVRQRHTPEGHYQLLSVYRGLANRQATPMPHAAKARKVSVALGRSQSLRVAFIGGRGVISKYSGIETYYEEVGKRLVEMGHEVTVYCRTHFTPAVAEHRGCAWCGCLRFDRSIWKR